jgi:hypothetical protein
MAPEHPSLARLAAIGLLVAAICNGASFYLKRTGVLEYEAYAEYWTHHCAAPQMAHERQCTAFTSPEKIAARLLLPALESPDAEFRYLYALSDAERPLKVIKDFFWAALIALSLIMLSRSGTPLRALVQAGPVLGLAAYSAVSFAASVALNGALIAFAGARFLMIPALALVGRWLAPHMRIVAGAVGWLLVIQLLLVPFELWRGIHLFREWSPWSLAGRVTGTMVQPNSLGIFAVMGLAFFYCFGRRAWLWPVAAVSLALVFFTRSGTGIFGIGMVLLIVAIQSVGPTRRTHAIVAGALLFGLCLLLLPQLTGRPDIFGSLGSSGRLGVLYSALFERPTAQVLLGSGLGVHTNLALSLTGRTGMGVTGIGSLNTMPTDSALIGLVIQIGVVGTLVFYGALLWAAVRDPVARPFYCAAALCSLTINLTELFPVNVLLGLALAHSIWDAGERSSAHDNA